MRKKRKDQHKNLKRERFKMAWCLPSGAPADRSKGNERLASVPDVAGSLGGRNEPGHLDFLSKLSLGRWRFLKTWRLSPEAKPMDTFIESCEALCHGYPVRAGGEYHNSLDRTSESIHWIREGRNVEKRYESRRRFRIFVFLELPWNPEFDIVGNVRWRVGNLLSEKKQITDDSLWVVDYLPWSKWEWRSSFYFDFSPDTLRLAFCGRKLTLCPKGYLFSEVSQGFDEGRGFLLFYGNGQEARSRF